MNNPNIPSSADQTASSVSDTAKRAWQATKDKAGDVFETGEQYVREHPATSVLSIFGLGFLVGAVIGWSIAHEDHDTNTDRAISFEKRLRERFNLD